MKRFALLLFVAALCLGLAAPVLADSYLYTDGNGDLNVRSQNGGGTQVELAPGAGGLGIDASAATGVPVWDAGSCSITASPTPTSGHPLLAALAGESWEVANEAAIRNFRAINKNPGQVAKLSVTCFV